MKAKSLRQKSVTELQGEIVSLRKEQFNLRMQRGTGQVVTEALPTGNAKAALYYEAMIYQIAKEIGGVANQTLIAPINRAVFPGYSRLSHDAERLRDAYKSTLGLIALAAVPASAGVAAISNLLVPVALGKQWQSAVPLLSHRAP